MPRSYTELAQYDTLEDRFHYLKLGAGVGDCTFGHNRWVNQHFYASTQWRHARQRVIARDMGCDLGVPGFEIHGKIYVHHMNPLSIDDIVHGDGSEFDPEFLISVTHRTHNAIHYGDERQLPRPFTERTPGDTQLWTPIRRVT